MRVVVEGLLHDRTEADWASRGGFPLQVADRRGASERCAEFLQAELGSIRDYLAPLRWLGDCPGGRPPKAASEDLWDLYAFSRLLQLLILPLQEFRPVQRAHFATDPWAPGFSPMEFETFCRALDLQLEEPACFHPFLCEVTDLVSAAPESQPEIQELRWPAVWLGRLLLLRAGTRVAAPAARLDPRFAPSSRLYWTYRRRDREYEDLSHGWGSNSQWRTSFRRDYRCAGRLIYNADGEVALHAASPPTDLELLRHRCFVTMDPTSVEDPYPYDHRWEEAVAE